MRGSPRGICRASSRRWAPSRGETAGDEAPLTPFRNRDFPFLFVGRSGGCPPVALAGQAGARVVGVDITDAWFDEARARAAVADVDIDLRLGDAEDLPVDDEGFDVVLSSFGAIFAPRHDSVASELVRVCRPGGVIALTAWTPGGANDTVFSTLLTRLPSLPAFVTPFIRWGDPAHVRDLFASTGVTLSFEHRDFEVEFPSVEAFKAFVFETSGGFARARRALEELGSWAETLAAFEAAIDDQQELPGGPVARGTSDSSRRSVVTRVGGHQLCDILARTASQEHIPAVASVADPSPLSWHADTLASEGKASSLTCFDGSTDDRACCRSRPGRAAGG
jgi:SAM-dependent methyltransferase